MKDRTTEGFIAGVIGAFPEMVFTLTLYYVFNAIRFRYLDFASVIAFNHLPKGLFQIIVAEFGVFVFTGFLGVIFSHLIKTISSRNIILKGAFFGISIWFFVYAFITFFKVRPLFPIGFQTSILHMIGGVIWGITTAWTYRKFVEKYGVE